MKRSEVNKHLSWAKDLLKAYHISLPPFGYWTLSDWQKYHKDAQTIKRVMLGWDITDFGQDDFSRLGAVLFTLRNGALDDANCGTPYAEKLILLRDGQRLPLHYHASKTEDIINRAGGVLAIKLYNSLPDGQVDDVNLVSYTCDGITRQAKPGQTIRLLSGESITLRPYQYHLFWAEEGSGDLVVGEVSSINDDHTDNYNAEAVSRFSTIEEDQAMVHPLCNEYASVFNEEVL